jgi:hypothetical protein
MIGIFLTQAPPDSSSTHGRVTEYGLHNTIKASAFVRAFLRLSSQG